MINFKKEHPLRILIIRTTPHNMDVFAPPLGPLHLAAAIRQKYPDVVIRIEDYALGGYTFHRLAEMAKSFNPNIVGLSGLTHEFSTFLNIVKDVQKACPEALYLAGGPIATHNYQEILESCEIDFAIRNEGEITILQLLDALYSGKDPYSILGISFKKDGEIKANPQQPFIENLDSFPIPAWDLIDLDKYAQLPNLNGILKEKKYAPVFTSRGCPFQCSYCHSIFGKKFRSRSAEHILKELRLLHDQFGVREIHIYDDVFNFRKDRAKEICQGIIDSDMNFAIAFPNGLRVDIMTEDLLDAFRRVGVYKINYAVETITPRLQAEIRKNIKLDKAKEVINMTSKKGIITFSFFMLGFASETREEIQNTIDFAVNSKLDTAKFVKVTPYKGTNMWDEAVKKNPALNQMNLKHFSFYDTSTSVCENVGEEELENLIRTAYRKFYIKPSRILRLLRKYPHRWQIVKKISSIYQFSNTDI